jgi:hypothetical protein
MARGSHPRCGAFPIQAGSDQARRREMQVPTPQRDQKLRELPRRPRDCDSFVGDAFCEVQHANAVVEHRGAGLLEIEPPRIDLAEMGDELGLEAVIALDQVVQLRQELIVRKALQRRHTR